MRRMVLLVAATTAILSMGAMPAMADYGPHVSSAFGAGVAGSVTTGVNTDRCAGCHRAHTGQGAFLLNATDETQLCYTCHGTAGAGATTNVVNGIQYNAGTPGSSKALTLGQPSNNSVIAGALRAGGFVTAAIGTGHMFQFYSVTTTGANACSRTTGVAGSCKFAELIPPLYTSYTGDTSTSTAASGATGVTNSGVYQLAPSTSQHSVDGSPVTSWGSGTTGSYSTDATINLQCVSCHDPHGNGNYRILRPVPNGAATGTPAVTIADSTVKGYTTTNYWLVDDPNSTQITVNAGAASTSNATGTYASSNFLANISAWCGTCHTRLLDSSSAWANALQNPVTTSVTFTKGTSAGTGFTYYGGVAYGSAPALADGTPVMFTTIGAATGVSVRTMYFTLGCATGTNCELTTDAAGANPVLISATGSGSIVAGQLVTWTGNNKSITPANGVLPTVNSQVVLLAVAPSAAGNYVNLGLYTGRNYKVVADGVSTTTFRLQGYDAHNGGSWSDTTPGVTGYGMYVVSVLANGTATGNVTSDSTYTFRHTSDKGYLSSYNGGTSSPGFTGTGTRDAWANNPNCITCHVAHGSNASMAGDSNSTTSGAVTFPNGSTGDSFLLRVDNRGTCRSCHNY